MNFKDRGLGSPAAQGFEFFAVPRHPAVHKLEDRRLRSIPVPAGIPHRRNAGLSAKTQPASTDRGQS